MDKEQLKTIFQRPRLMDNDPRPMPLDPYDADSLIDIRVDRARTWVDDYLDNLPPMSGSFKVREGHAIVPSDSPARYTGPMCTEQEPCHRCAAPKAHEGEGGK